jgi:hypothetical protein
VFHHLGRDAQTAGHLLSIAADQRSEHELFEALARISHQGNGIGLPCVSEMEL